jgi:cysteine desulfurase
VTRHYLDHASTSPPRPEVTAAMSAVLEGTAADPGRLHEEGRQVRALVETAREQVAALYGVRPRQVVFTSSGTEAVNAAAWGASRARPGAPILFSDVEHSAVRAASERLAPTVVLGVDAAGRLDLGALDEALAAHRSPSPALVHCQLANHEVATVQPVADVVTRCRDAGVPVHVDAAAAGPGVLDLGVLGADLVSLSAHKLGGPPGIGALIVTRGTRVEPLLVGGDQERARRAGLENVPAIAGYGALAEVLGADGHARGRAEAETARRQIERLVALAEEVGGVQLVGEREPTRRAPHLVCLGVAGVEGEPVLLALDRAGIAAHSGSACSSESFEPSPVLAAMGADPSHSLRLSVGWSTTGDDVEAFGEAFAPAVDSLRALRS